MTPKTLNNASQKDQPTTAPRVTPHVESARKVYCTQDYDAFVFMEANRPVRPSHVSDLKSSMLRYGNLLDLYPIVVLPQKVRGGEKLEIHEGQHRFHAARELREAIYYIRDDTGRLSLRVTQATNTYQQRWSYADYLHSYCVQGHADYLSLRAFLDKYPFPLMMAIQMTHTGDDRASRLDFKVGLFKMRGSSFAIYVGDILRRVSADVSFCWQKGFIAAVAMLARNPEFDPDRLVEKILQNRQNIQKQPGTMDYFDRLLEVYNWHVHRGNIQIFSPIDADGRVCKAGRWVTDADAAHMKEEATRRIQAYVEEVK